MIQTNSSDLWTIKLPILASKKRVNSAYQPNTYRIFSENIPDFSANRSSALGSSRNPSRQNDALHRKNLDTPLASLSRDNSKTYWHQQDSFLKKKTGFVENHPKDPTRRHAPHPVYSKFLRSNVAELNSGLPCILPDTSNSKDRLSNVCTWFKHPSSLSENVHGSVKNRRHKSVKIIEPMPKIVRQKSPKNHDWILRHDKHQEGRFLEHISYQHEMDIRQQCQPVRGKLHGSIISTEVR